MGGFLYVCRYQGKEDELFSKIMSKYSETPSQRLKTPRLSRGLQKDIKIQVAKT